MGQKWSKYTMWIVWYSLNLQFVPNKTNCKFSSLLFFQLFYDCCEMLGLARTVTNSHDSPSSSGRFSASYLQNCCTSQVLQYIFFDIALQELRSLLIFVILAGFMLENSRKIIKYNKWQCLHLKLIYFI